jgi:hypothetical protein
VHLRGLVRSVYLRGLVRSVHLRGLVRSVHLLSGALHAPSDIALLRFLLAPALAMLVLNANAASATNSGSAASAASAKRAGTPALHTTNLASGLLLCLGLYHGQFSAHLRAM